MPTPFTDDGTALSEVRLARLVREVLKRPIEGVVVAPDAGEFWALTVDERKTLLEMVLREVRGAVPVWCHVSSLRTATSLDLAQHAEQFGLVVEQAEDEIAAINLCLGATYAGATGRPPPS